MRFFQGGKSSFGHSQPFSSILIHSHPFPAIRSHSQPFSAILSHSQPFEWLRMSFFPLGVFALTLSYFPNLFAILNTTELGLVSK
jgi:hypothetical protein